MARKAAGKAAVSKVDAENSKMSDTAKDILKLLAGELILDGIVCLVFALIDKFNYTVPLGALLGTAVNTLCFFILCISVNKVISDGDEIKGKRTMTVSFFLRMAILALGLAVGFKFGCFNKVAVIVPVVSTRPILSVYSLFGKEKKGDDGTRS